jgi:MoaA/NifB/PqqE/SkfB family radical SAM enzyme
MNDLVINPTTLSIITTYKCTSSCKDCCFQSNPQRKEKLTVPEIKKYISETVKAYSSIKVLVLTGGECFLYGKKLEDIIKHASSYGLITRIVTNGFWAKDYNKADETLID